MSRCGRAIDLLDDWRENPEFAEVDAWTVLTLIEESIDPFFHRRTQRERDWLAEVLEDGQYPNYEFIGIPKPDPLPESRKQAWLDAAREVSRRTI